MRERRPAGPGAWPGEAAGAEGAGAAPGGSRRARGACLCVWGWRREWVRGRAPVATARPRFPAVAGAGGFCAVRARGVRGRARARVVRRGRRVWTCVGAGPQFSFCPTGAQGAGRGARACPGAVPPARGCFPNGLPAGDGCAAARARGGSAAPTSLLRPGRLGTQTSEGGREERAPRSPLACPQGEAEMGRLRQMDGEAEAGKQSETGNRGRETAKRTAARRTESH